MCARMYVLCGVRHCVIHAEHYTLVCVASCGDGAFRVTLETLADTRRASVAEVELAGTSCRAFVRPFLR